MSSTKKSESPNVLLTRNLSGSEKTGRSFNAFLESQPTKRSRVALRRKSDSPQTRRLKDLSTMAVTLAHEIRNPLASIEGAAQLLKRDLLEKTHQQMVETILQASAALNRLVSHVLDYARPLQLHYGWVDLVPFIQETLMIAQIAHKSRVPQPRFEFASFSSTQRLWLDREWIKLALLNLLNNAVESGASLIKISLSEASVLTLEDNGSGIKKKNLDKVFTPFFTTKASGTGLGLTIALAVVRAHKGKLELLSKEGQGTRISIHFS